MTEVGCSNLASAGAVERGFDVCGLPPRVAPCFAAEVGGLDRRGLSEYVPGLVLAEVVFGGGDGGGRRPEPSAPCCVSDVAGFRVGEVDVGPCLCRGESGASKREGVAVLGFGSALAGVTS